IVDSRSEFIDTHKLSAGTLLLITCYPFDSMDAGGPLRYVVEAHIEDDRSQGQLSQGSLGEIDTVAGL
ncbi:MAG: class GN sortase, partial [Marinobacter sp.]